MPTSEPIVERIMRGQRAYDKYKELLKQLDAIRAKNNDKDSLEEDAILDAMDVPWLEMTGQERGSFRR